MCSFISASQQAFFRYNGKFTLKAGSVLIYVEMRYLNLKTAIEIRTKLWKTVGERQIGKEKKMNSNFALICAEIADRCNKSNH